jgi:protein TonB
MQMNGRADTTLRLLVALLIIAAAPPVGAQGPTSPPPSGNHIIARDGDVIVVENDAQVGVVRRRGAYARVVFNAEERWFLLLVDHETPGRPADGRVDWTYSFREVDGAWPFDARWEGHVTIDEYSVIGQGGQGGVGIVTPDGLVQLFARQGEFKDRNAVAVLSYRGGGQSGTNNLGFDEAERWFITQVRRNDGVMQLPPGGAAHTSMGFRTDIGASDPSGAVRVGGNVRPPRKIFDVRPAMPDEAAGAGIRGIVILEITIDVDGTVKDARVLRSIPMLDAAALEAVRRWRYDATTIDGKAMPVIMTVSVNFQ